MPHKGVDKSSMSHKSVVLDHVQLVVYLVKPDLAVRPGEEVDVIRDSCYDVWSLWTCVLQSLGRSKPLLG